MRLPSTALLALLPTSLVLALPRSHTASADTDARPLPLLIWHGLGDKFDNPGLRSTGELAQKIHPGTQVHYIRVADDSSADQRATFFGNISAQIEDVCHDVTTDKKLVDPGTGKVRADALGFSQGGQFLRGLVERCPGISVRSLVTFGSQHNGIAEFQKCGTWDLLCKGASALVGGNAWTDYVQRTVVPAQYYREVNTTTGYPTDGFLEKSHFLGDINGEIARDRKRNPVYAERIEGLERFVMYVFEEDTTVVPRESGWFAEVNVTDGAVTHLRDRKIYKEDWIGLQKLDGKAGLVFRGAPGGHMQLDDKVLKEAFTEFFGPEKEWQREEKVEVGVGQQVLGWHEDV